MRPLVIDLFCGLGGWSKGFLAEGYRAVGFDIERHDYGNGGYPGELVLQDIMTVHGSQFRDAACIVASPPCQRYSYMAMPWKRAKALIAWHRENQARVDDLNALFNACFRIQLEASRAKGEYIPMVVENVKGAQPWVGRAKWHFGSFYLWGDVPALMPITLSRVAKVPGLNWSGSDKPGYVAKAFNNTAIAQMAVKTVGHVDKRDGYSHTRHLTNQRESDAVKQAGLSGPLWFDHGAAAHSSKSLSRKAASAAIAEIPFELSAHIARCFYPR